MKFISLSQPLLILILTLFTASLGACYCEMEEWNDATFERYDFVAHVKVLGIDEVNGPIDLASFSWNYALLRVEILELYQGMEETLVCADLILSCGLSVFTGEEWILFANIDRAGNLFFHACSPSTEYRDKDGQKTLSWGYPSRVKHWVDTTCQVTLPGISYSGRETFRTYYANDQLEEQTGYLDGKKHGQSVHYYPDGTLMDEREYYQGKPIKLRRYYEQDGSPNFELEYNFRGELVRETNYLNGYDKLRHEILYVPEIDLQKDFAFRTDGSLAEMIIRQDWDKVEEKYYDTVGHLIHHLVYDEDREVIVLLDSLRQ